VEFLLVAAEVLQEDIIRHQVVIRVAVVETVAVQTELI
jgi:hypothetical protein